MCVSFVQKYQKVPYLCKSPYVFCYIHPRGRFLPSCQLFCWVMLRSSGEVIGCQLAWPEPVMQLSIVNLTCVHSGRGLAMWSEARRNWFICNILAPTACMQPAQFLTDFTNMIDWSLYSCTAFTREILCGEYYSYWNRASHLLHLFLPAVPYCHQSIDADRQKMMPSNYMAPNTHTHTHTHTTHTHTQPLTHICRAINMCIAYADLPMTSQAASYSTHVSRQSKTP